MIWLCLFLLSYPHNPGLGAREKTYINSLVPSPSPQTTNHTVATAGLNDDRFNRPKANAPWQQQDSKLQAVPGEDQHCTAGRQDPVKGFYFVKVAKTGTTTICSMMTRFIRLNNLSVLTPVKGYAVQWWKERNIGQSFSSKSIYYSNFIENWSLSLIPSTSTFVYLFVCFPPTHGYPGYLTIL